MNNDKIEKYCKEMAEEFAKKYSDELDDTINLMLEHFGFNKEKHNSSEWLKERQLELLMDEEYREEDKIKRKTIFLLDKKIDTVVAVFLVEIKNTDGDITYRISDVFVNPSIDE